MKRRCNKRIALMLAFVLTFINVVPAFGAEVSATSENGQKFLETSETEAGQTGDTSDEKDEVSADAGEDDEPAEAASEDSVSDDRADEKPAAPAADGKKEEAAGDGDLIAAEVPANWLVTSGEAAEWKKSGSTGKYYVYFKDDAYIQYKPDHFDVTEAADVTICSSDGINKEINVIVEGSEYDQGTSVSVDSSLSGNVYVAHGSIVEKEDGFIRVQGLDENGQDIDHGDYEEGDPNTVKYESGWKVYKEKKSEGLTLNFEGGYFLVGYSMEQESPIQFYKGSDHELLYERGREESHTDPNSWYRCEEPARKMREITRSASADFVIKSKAGLSWLNINKTPDAPETSDLVNLEMKNYSTVKSSGVGIYDKATGDLYCGEAGDGRRFFLSSNYTNTATNETGRSSTSGLSFDCESIGALGTDYYLYVRNTAENAFSTDFVKVEALGSIRPAFRTPVKEDISDIKMTESSISFSQESYDCYPWSYQDKRGNSRLKFIIADSRASLDTVSNASVENWKGRSRYYDSGERDTGKELEFDKVINSSGVFENLTIEQKVDIYAAWFLPSADYNEYGYIPDPDYFGNGRMEGSPVKLYSFTYTGNGQVMMPLIKFKEDDDYYNTSYIDLPYQGEEKPLFTEEQIRKRFRAFSNDKSEQTLNGTFTLRAISRNDPDAEAFRKQTTLSEGSLGRDVTEEGDWHAGSYYLLAYFEPYDDELDGDIYLSTIKEYNLYIEYREVNLETEINVPQSASSYDEWTVSIGDQIRYEDISTGVCTYYDEEGNWIGWYGRKKCQNLSVNNLKYLVRIVSGNKPVVGEGDEGEALYGNYEYEKRAVLEKPGDSIALDKEGKYQVLVYRLSATLTDENGNETEDYKFYVGSDYWDYYSSFEVTEDEVLEHDKYYQNGDYDRSYDIRVINFGTITLTSRGNELPYGVANQLRTDVINGFGRARSNRVEQMSRLFYVSCNSVDAGELHYEKYLDYVYSTSKDGTYGSIGDIPAADLELGKTLWVKAVMLETAFSEPASVVIGKQPINIAAVYPSVTDPGEELKGTYEDDIYVYYMNPYPNENPRELKGKLSDWSNSDKAAIDLSGIDKDKEDTTKKTTLSITLNAEKLTHFELRSTAAIYIVRSKGAIEPKSGGAIVVKPDSPVEMKKDEIERDKYIVQFIDAKSGEKLAESRGWYKDSGLPEKTQVKLASADLGVWSLGSDCSDQRMDITAEGIVTNEDTVYTFDLKEAMKLLKGTGVSVITFYGYRTENLAGYIRINKIAPVSFNGNAHISTKASAAKNKSNDLFVSVCLESDGGKTVTPLTEGKDYSLKYEDNKKAGTGTVKVIGKGTYKGLSATKNFTINPADMKDAVLIVSPSYKYTAKGVKPAPKITVDGRELKEGSAKDYTFELVEEDLKKVTGSYNKNSDPHKFRLKVTGCNDYAGEIYSQTFWGVPSNLKALSVTLGNSSVKYADNKTFVTVEDYFNVSDGRSKVSNFRESVSAQLYDEEYVPVEKGFDTGKYYYVGVRAAEPEKAIEAGISPAVTFKKVKFTGLKFNKNLFEFDKNSFDFTNSNNAVSLKAKSGASVSWADVQVTFSDYYTADGDMDLPFARGVKEPRVNDGKTENILENMYPASYTVYVTGSGRYYGTFKMTYKVNPMKAKPGDNMEVIVNDGKGVYYNASGYDAATAPVKIVLRGAKGDEILEDVTLDLYYNKKSSVKDGGKVNVRGVYTAGGTRVFSNGVSKKFTISACDLAKALSMNSGEFGAVRKMAVNLGAKVPLLTLLQLGPFGSTVLSKGDFAVEENIRSKAEAAKGPFELKVKASGVNYTGGSFTVSGVDAYNSTYSKAKLKFSPGDAAELNNSGSYGIKNKKGNLYYKYTGKAVEPGVIIKDKTGNVISDEFYDVSYENNTFLSTSKAPAKAVVTFKRSAKTMDYPYGGSTEIKFYIVTDYSSEK